MALQRIQHVPFSLEELIRRGVLEDVTEGLAPLRNIDLDFTRPHVPGIWRPSRLHRCIRKQIYKLHKVPEDGLWAPDEITEWRFMRGHIFGAWCQGLLMNLEGRYGISHVDCETVVSDDDSALGGKLDATFRRNGIRYVVEIKSKEQPLKPNMTLGKLDHLQLNDYMRAEKCRHGFLIYFGPKRVPNTQSQTFGMVEFPVEFSPDLWDESENRTRQLTWFARSPHLLPPATGNPFMDCRTCPWKVTCQAGLTPELAKS